MQGQQNRVVCIPKDFFFVVFPNVNGIVEFGGLNLFS